MAEYLVVARPGQVPEISMHQGEVTVELLREIIGSPDLGRTTFESLSRARGHLCFYLDEQAHIWPALANRRMPNGRLLSGTVVLCRVVKDQPRAFSASEASSVATLVGLWHRAVPARPPLKLVPLDAD